MLKTLSRPSAPTSRIITFDQCVSYIYISDFVILRIRGSICVKMFMRLGSVFACYSRRTLLQAEQCYNKVQS